MKKIHKKPIIGRWIFLLLTVIIGTVIFAIGLDNQKNPVVQADQGYFITNSPTATSGDTSISITGESSYVYLKAAGDHVLSASDTLTWISGSSDVINVENQHYENDANGVKYAVAKITSVSPGSTTLTAQLKNAAGDIWTVLVNVTVELEINKDNEGNTDTTPGFFSSIFSTDLQARYLVMNRDEEMSMSVMTKTDPTKLDWDVSNDSVVKIIKDTQNKRVKVVAVGSGQANITASTTLGKYDSETITVFVQPQLSNGGVYGGQDSANPIVIGSSDIDTYYLAFTAKRMEDIAFKVYEGTSTSGKLLVNTETNITSELIKLSNATTPGMIKIEAKAGKYFIESYIKGMGDNGRIKHAYASLDVKPKLTQETLNQSINVGNTYDLCSALNVNQLSDFFVMPPQIENINVANVDGEWNNGVIKGLNSGKTTITLTSKTNSLEKYILNLTVIDGIALDRAYAEMYVGGSFSLTTVKPTGSGSVVWSSSNTNVATVSTNGTVTGRGTGTATITATLTIGGVTKKATCEVLVKASVSSIVLSPTSTTLSIGEYKTIKATIQPTNFTNLNIRWVSSDESVAVIEESNTTTATIQGISGGEAVITAINMDNAIVGTCKVKVVQPITSLELNHTKINTNLSMGMIQLIANWQNGATATKLSWQSTNSTVATVNEDGLVSLVGAGTTNIIVRPTFNPNNIMVMCSITVHKSVTGIVLDSTARTMEVGDTYRLSYVITPLDATNQGVVWSTMDAKVATVNATGLITAVGPGQTYIIAKTADGSHTATFAVTIIQDATGIQLDVSDITLRVGEIYDINATTIPATSTEKNLTWTSKNTGIATVSNTGKIKAISAGETIITVKTKKGSVAFVYVTVQQSVSGLSLNYSEKTVTRGRTFLLKPIFQPANASIKTVTWKSSNSKIATVTQGGTVKGVKGGTVIITATSKDGGYVAACVVTVKEPITSIKLNRTYYSLGLGKKYTLKPTVKTTSASNQKLKWTSSNKKVAIVDSKGKVTAKKFGTTTITVTATDGTGAEAECTIRVVRQVTSIRLNRSSVTLVEGKAYKLTAKIYPTNATYRTARWTTTNKTVAIVDSTGKITTLKPGTATIKAAAKDNSGRAAYCIVNVIKAVPATGITVSQKDMTLVRGATGNVSIAVQPSNTTDKITYASDSRAVATVSSKGRVTARKSGVATITITTSSGKQGYVNVTVVGLNVSSIVMEQYDTRVIWVDGLSKGVNWYSANPSVATIRGGKIVARKVGTTTVYATVNGIRLGCRVRVKRIP